jgi:hypothetical protein
MKIRFLRDCEGMQNQTRVFCECCGPEPDGTDKVNFFKGNDEDPNVTWHEIDLTTLKYKEDYEIIEYP